MLRLIAGFFSLMLVLPGFAFAEGAIENNSIEAHSAGKCEKGSCAHYQVHRELKETEIMIWAEKYTPGQAGEWKAVFAERKALEARWLSPEMKGKRDAWKEERVRRFEEIAELKKQMAEGKITREEYVKQSYEKMKRGHGKAMRGHAVYLRLKEAAETNNAKEAASLLNELLEFHRQHNEKLKVRLEK